MSIDWFDVEAVKAAMLHNEIGLRGDKHISYQVLKAIAALPEPKDGCGACGGPEPSTIHHVDSANPEIAFAAHRYDARGPMLRRIWLVAKEVVGE